MTAMQGGIGSAYNVPDRPRSGPECPMTARFPAESRARRQVPGTEPRFRSLRSDTNEPMDLLVAWAMLQKRMLPGGVRSDPNAPSSSEAVAGDAYRLFPVPGPRWPADALAALADGANTGDAYRPFPVPESRWLADALGALAEVDDEIAEEDLPPVDGATKTEAERIIKALARRAPAPAPTVYPTQDAEIALHFKSPDRPDAVVILLNNRGQADCHAYIDGRGRRSHYDTSSDLPDAFVLDQLRRLTPDRADAPASGAGVFPPPTTFLPTSLHLMR